jgi:hypothetical protein
MTEESFKNKLVNGSYEMVGKVAHSVAHGAKRALEQGVARPLLAEMEGARQASSGKPFVESVKKAWNDMSDENMAKYSQEQKKKGK